MAEGTDTISEAQPTPCTWVYFQPALTCADISLSNIGIRQCVSALIAPGGGAGLIGALQGIHPDLDGLPTIGSGAVDNMVTSWESLTAMY